MRGDLRGVFDAVRAVGVGLALARPTQQLPQGGLSPADSAARTARDGGRSRDTNCPSSSGAPCLRAKLTRSSALRLRGTPLLARRLTALSRAAPVAGPRDGGIVS